MLQSDREILKRNTVRSVMWYPGNDLDPALSGLCIPQNSVL